MSDSAIARDVVTRELSELTVKRLNSQHRFWASEVALDKHCGGTRVDYLSFDPATDRGALVPASVERGIFTCYEIKSCMADFKSGCGLNFFGDRNYLVCTRDLAEKLRGELNIGMLDAVLVPDKSNSKLYNYYTLTSRSPIRERTAGELLWAMIVSKGATTR